MHLYITRGSGPRFVPARLIVVRPAPNRHRETGKVWLAPWRIDPRNPSVGSKTMAYFPNVMASDRAERSGFDDVIIINTRGRVADGARASVFTVEGGDLRTPSFRDGALAGVVRQILIDAARSHGMRVRLGGLTPATLLKADAVFLSSSLRGLRLAHQVGNQALRTTPRAARAFDTLRSSYRLAIRRELLSRQP
jgi:branched-subunit amino acid aminotransferase/4-amino-4-deoxychorismate lyase